MSILCGTDFSERSRHAADVAAHFAARTNVRAASRACVRFEGRSLDRRDRERRARARGEGAASRGPAPAPHRRGRANPSSRRASGRGSARRRDRAAGDRDLRRCAREPSRRQVARRKPRRSVGAALARPGLRRARIGSDRELGVPAAAAARLDRRATFAQRRARDEVGRRPALARAVRDQGGRPVLAAASNSSASA